MSRRSRNSFACGDGEPQDNLPKAFDKAIHDEDLDEHLIHQQLRQSSRSADSFRALTPESHQLQPSERQSATISEWQNVSPLTSVHYVNAMARGEPVGGEYQEEKPTKLPYHSKACPKLQEGIVSQDLELSATMARRVLDLDDPGLFHEMTTLSKWQSVKPADYKKLNTVMLTEETVAMQSRSPDLPTARKWSRDYVLEVNKDLSDDNTANTSTPSGDSEAKTFSVATSLLPDSETSSEAVRIAEEWDSTSTAPDLEDQLSNQTEICNVPLTATNVLPERRCLARSDVQHTSMQSQSAFYLARPSGSSNESSALTGTQRPVNSEPEQRVTSPSLLSTSSIATCKQLEWDSGADIGYGGPKVTYGLSTLEKMAIGSYCSGIQRLEPEGHNAHPEVFSSVQNVPASGSMLMGEKEKRNERVELEQDDISPKIFVQIESSRRKNPPQTDCKESSDDGIHSPRQQSQVVEWPVSNVRPSCVSINPFCSTAVNDDGHCLPTKLSFHTPRISEHLQMDAPDGVAQDGLHVPIVKIVSSQSSVQESASNDQGTSPDNSYLSQSRHELSPNHSANKKDHLVTSSSIRSETDRTVIVKTKKFVDEVCRNSDVSKRRSLLKKILEDLGISLRDDDIMALYHNSVVCGVCKKDLLPHSTDIVIESCKKVASPPYSESDGSHQKKTKSHYRNRQSSYGNVVIKPYSSLNSDYVFYAPVEVDKLQSMATPSQDLSNRNKSEPGSPIQIPDKVILMDKHRNGDKVLQEFPQDVHRVDSDSRAVRASGNLAPYHNETIDIETTPESKKYQNNHDVRPAGPDGQRTRPNNLKNKKFYQKLQHLDQTFLFDSRLESSEHLSSRETESPNQSPGLRNPTWQSRHLRKEIFHFRKESHSSCSSTGSNSVMVSSSHSIHLNDTNTSRPSRTRSTFSFDSRHHYYRPKPKPVETSSRDSVNCSVGYVSSNPEDYHTFPKGKSKEWHQLKDLYYVKELIHRQRSHYIKKFRQELEWLERVENYLALPGSSHQSTCTESASSSSLFSGRLHLLNKLENMKTPRAKREVHQKAKPMSRTSQVSQNGSSLLTDQQDLKNFSQDFEAAPPCPTDIGTKEILSSACTEAGTQTSVQTYNDSGNLDEPTKSTILTAEQQTKSTQQAQSPSSKAEKGHRDLQSEELKVTMWFIPFHQNSSEECLRCQRNQKSLQAPSSGNANVPLLALQGVFQECNPKVMKQLVSRHQRIKSQTLNSTKRRAKSTHNEINVISIKMKQCNYTVPMPISTHHHNPHCRSIFCNEAQKYTNRVYATLPNKYCHKIAKRTRERNHVIRPMARKKFEEKVRAGKSSRPNFHKCI